MERDWLLRVFGPDEIQSRTNCYPTYWVTRLGAWVAGIIS